MNVREGDLQRPGVSMDHAAHEAEKAALRLRIARLEAILQRTSAALRRLLAIHEPLDSEENG